MTNVMAKTKLIAVLAITIGFVVIGALNLRDRLSPTTLPYDGITWVATENGLQVRAVDADSPLAYNIKKGDYLRAVYFVGRNAPGDGPRTLTYEQVKSVEALQLYLDRQGVGNDARYAIEHHDPTLQKIYGLKDDERLFDVDFKVSAAPQFLGRDLYLAFIGLVYLAIGLFVLFKQNRAALTHHFFVWALVSFIVYFLNASRERTPFDTWVGLLDNAGLAMKFMQKCRNTGAIKASPAL